MVRPLLYINGVSIRTKFTHTKPTWILNNLHYSKPGLRDLPVAFRHNLSLRPRRRNPVETCKTADTNPTHHVCRSPTAALDMPMATATDDAQGNAALFFLGNPFIIKNIVINEYCIEWLNISEPKANFYTKKNIVATVRYEAYSSGRITMERGTEKARLGGATGTSM